MLVWILSKIVHAPNRIRRFWYAEVTAQFISRDSLKDARYCKSGDSD